MRRNERCIKICPSIFMGLYISLDKIELFKYIIIEIHAICSESRAECFCHELLLCCVLLTRVFVNFFVCVCVLLQFLCMCMLCGISRYLHSDKYCIMFSYIASMLLRKKKNTYYYGLRIKQNNL